MLGRIGSVVTDITITYSIHWVFPIESFTKTRGMLVISITWYPHRWCSDKCVATYAHFVKKVWFLGIFVVFLAYKPQYFHKMKLSIAKNHLGRIKNHFWTQKSTYFPEMWKICAYMPWLRDLGNLWIIEKFPNIHVFE